MWLKRTSYFLLILILLSLIAAWLAGNRMTVSTNSPIANPDDATQISIPVNEEVALQGDYWPAPNANAPAILLLHGNGGNRTHLTQLARLLNQNGFHILAIDLRGHGASTPAEKSFGLNESEDARAAFNMLKTRHPNSKLGVIGFSLGGAAALLGKDGPLPADALVLKSVYSDIRTAIYNRISTQTGPFAATILEPLLSFQSLPRYGVWPSKIAPIKAIGKAKGAIMVVGGGEDIYTPPQETTALYNAANGTKELWILDGLDHNQMAVAEFDNPEYQARLLKFLNRNLRV